MAVDLLNRMGQARKLGSPTNCFARQPRRLSDETVASGTGTKKRPSDGRLTTITHQTTDHTHHTRTTPGPSVRPRPLRPAAGVRVPRPQSPPAGAARWPAPGRASLDSKATACWPARLCTGQLSIGAAARPGLRHESVPGTHEAAVAGPAVSPTTHTYVGTCTHVGQHTRGATGHMGGEQRCVCVDHRADVRQSRPIAPPNSHFSPLLPTAIDRPEI